MTRGTSRYRPAWRRSAPKSRMTTHPTPLRPGTGSAVRSATFASNCASRRTNPGQVARLQELLTLSESAASSIEARIKQQGDRVPQRHQDDRGVVVDG